MRTTRAPGPTSQVVSVVSGPISAPPPTVVAPCSWVPGCSTTSRSSRTWTSTQVLAGSTTVTPDRIQCSEQPVVELGAQLRELDPVVGPADLPLVGADHAAHLGAVVVRDLDQVGEVELALVVGRREAPEPGLEERAVEGVHPGVDLADRLLLRVASACSTMRVTVPSVSRSTRP